MSNDIQTGRIKFYTPAKGFGFIRMKIPGGDTEDVYFSVHSLVNPFSRPFKNDKVQFKLRGAKNRLQAYAVERIEKSIIN